MSRRPLPLSLPLSDHVLYSEIIQIGKDGGRILDLGCGPGKDLFQLFKDGVPPSNVLGIDSESQFQPTFDLLARRGSLFYRPQLIVGDLTTLFPGSTPTSGFASWFKTNKGTFAVVICNRLLHLLSPLQHAPFLALLFSFLLPSSESPLLLAGLQRALPLGEVSGYRSISSSPRETDGERHWLWNDGDWRELLEEACRQSGRGGKVEWSSEYLKAGEGVVGGGRGAERWWVRVKGGAAQ